MCNPMLEWWPLMNLERTFRLAGRISLAKLISSCMGHREMLSSEKIKKRSGLQPFVHFYSCTFTRTCIIYKYTKKKISLKFIGCKCWKLLVHVIEFCILLSFIKYKFLEEEFLHDLSPLPHSQISFVETVYGSTTVWGYVSLSKVYWRLRHHITIQWSWEELAVSIHNAEERLDLDKVNTLSKPHSVRQQMMSLLNMIIFIPVM